MAWKCSSVPARIENLQRSSSYHPLAAIPTVKAAYSSFILSGMISVSSLRARCCFAALFLHRVAALQAEYDYIIVGGGTCGLTVANRLSELPNITVAVIEAGASVNDNELVYNVNDFTLALGTSIDWQYESTNQTYAAGQKVAYHAGKALGGSSTINGMTYIRAEKAQIDSWETLGNPGWNWDDLFPYYLKSESFDIPTPAQFEAGASYVPADHGGAGPLKVGYPYGLLNGSLHETFIDTWANLGIPHNLDVNGGSVRGFTVWQSTLDREKNVRQDAARAYYYPIESRPNFHVYLNTTVNKINWKMCRGAVADGVQVTYQNGSVANMIARKEVVVSAGSLRSPAILELSGIGNPAILSKHGIAIKVNLPAVGENLQDQPNVGFVYIANDTYNGTTGFVAYGSLVDILPPRAAPNISEWAATVSNAINNSVQASSLTKLLQIQYDLLIAGVPNAETLAGPPVQFGGLPSGYLFAAFWLLMPFSRGSVHISSADPLAYPAINPNYFLIDFDLEVQVAIAKWTRKFWTAAPIGSMFTEVSPGDEVPFNATDEEWATYIKGSFTANSHPLGTAAMMSRELGGVVDSRLKVYGTENVRVIDASVMPFQVSGHLTSTLYAIAEKASDLVKEDLKGFL